jgi:Glutaredoxin
MQEHAARIDWLTVHHMATRFLVRLSQVMLFMKGNKMFPQCGFSNTAVGILKALEVDFETFDVLADPDIRVVSTHIHLTCLYCNMRRAIGLSNAPAFTCSHDEPIAIV